MSTYWHHRLREHEVNQMRERIGSGVQYEIAFFFVGYFDAACYTVLIYQKSCSPGQYLHG